MSIEKEIRDYIMENSRKDSKKDRNFELVAYHYGFRDQAWPTYDVTKSKFDIGTKEAVRIILNRYARSITNTYKIPSVYHIIDLISSKDYWVCSELMENIKKTGLVGDNFSIRGLLNLFSDLKIDHEYEIYDCDLQKSSRRIIDNVDKTFVISDKIIEKMQGLYSLVVKLPGQCGIANINYLKNYLVDNEMYRLICLLIQKSENAWCLEEGEGLWYILENRENTLNNYSSKLFGVVDVVDYEKLSDCYKKALHGRKCEYPYPPRRVIKEYIRTSKKFTIKNNGAHYLGEIRELCDIEKSVVDYLQEKEQVSHAEIRDYLLTNGYTIPYINKAVFFSPLVYVDKSLGKGSHMYSFVGNSKYNNCTREILRIKYNKRLSKIYNKGSDINSKSKIRREQSILKDYIFSGKDHVRCAICGKNFMRDSIVAAHKKKRRYCTEKERLDINIVMPLCKFGCDHLYENRYLIVVDGKVVANKVDELLASEAKKVRELDGRNLQKFWLQGDKSYFDN
ncbi:hypothetical protein [Desulfonatronum parangueonense]